MKTITKKYLALLITTVLAGLYGLSELSPYDSEIKLYFSSIAITYLLTFVLTIVNKQSNKNPLLFVLNLLVCITSTLHAVFVIGVIIIFGDYLDLDESEPHITAVLCIAYTVSLTYLAGKHVSPTGNHPTIEQLEIEEQKPEQDTTF